MITLAWRDSDWTFGAGLGPPSLLKRNTAGLSSVSTQLYQGGICHFCEFWVLVFILSKKNNFFFSFSKKKFFGRNVIKMLE